MARHTYDRSIGQDPDAVYSPEKLEESRRVLSSFIADHPRALIAFSGGKDSIVAAHIAVQLGVRDAICETSFCFARQVQDFRASADQMGLNAVFKDSLSYEWLAKHPRWVMTPLKQQPTFYGLRQHRTIKTHARANGYTGIIYGRRIEENTVPAPIYQTVDGLSHCHPLRRWTTSEVWSYIHAHGLLFPDLYNHVIGRVEGNTPHNRLPPEHFPDPWPVIHSYDQTVVPIYAQFNAAARSFLQAHA